MPPAEQKTLLSWFPWQLEQLQATSTLLLCFQITIWEIIHPSQLHSPAGTKGTYLHPLEPASHHTYVFTLLPSATLWPCMASNVLLWVHVTNKQLSILFVQSWVSCV